MMRFDQHCIRQCLLGSSRLTCVAYISPQHGLSLHILLVSLFFAHERLFPLPLQCSETIKTEARAKNNFLLFTILQLVFIVRQSFFQHFIDFHLKHFPCKINISPPMFIPSHHPLMEVKFHSATTNNTVHFGGLCLCMRVHLRAR